jgi:hypothetical protein
VSAAFELKRVGRSLGIVAVFTVLGPLVVGAMLLLVVLAVGVPILQLLLTIIDLEALRPWLSIAAFLLVMIGLVVAVPPACLTGFAFAVAAVYFGANSVWVAIAAAALVGIGIVVMGFFVSPSDSSALMVPSPQGLRQAVVLSLVLTFPAAAAASLCWLASRALHRTPA